MIADVSYIDSMDDNAVLIFTEKMTYMLKGVGEATPIVILCVGTDRITGDSLGPLIGHKLRNMGDGFVYGTLEQPVHAKNLPETLREIHSLHKSPFIIAIDASLGSARHIGYVTMGKGSIIPGAGINKALPAVGDIFITGIVNYYSSNHRDVLQNTRLHTVMKMADVVSLGIKTALKKAKSKNN